MGQASSASDGGQPDWDYIRTGLGRSGRSLSEHNFAKERRDWLSILLREVLQNALDARVSRSQPVVVSIRHQALDKRGAAFLNELLTAEHLARLKASVPHSTEDQTAAAASCLVVEDFGTCGLTGVLDQPELDGKGQNWNAFWFREGEGGKENTSGNGGAGQGKITYFSTSGVRTIFAYTIRADDPQAVIFGASSFLRDYEYQQHKWKRDSYWGLWSGSGDDRIVMPTGASAIVENFCANLSLQRKANQLGLSLVIPLPKAFEMVDAVQITLAEFFVPILRGDLIVSLGDTTIDNSSVVALANELLTDERARELHTCTTAGYRAFLADAIGRSARNEVIRAKPVASHNQLSESTFEPAQLTALREAIENEQPIAVRFPVTVKSKTEGQLECHFDVHLVCPFDMDRPEQAVIRRDLLIGEEPIGGGRLRQRARGLTLVSDDSLSKLLLSAEEATHLRWNTRLPRLAEYYRSGADVVAMVRNAMVRLLDVLTGGEQKRDFKLLSKYFSAPGLYSAIQTKGKKSSKGKEPPPPPTDLPLPTPKLLSIEALEDGCKVRPAKAGQLAAAHLPLEVKVEFAYEGLDKDAFSEYDPLDFDLGERAFSIRPSGCSIHLRKFNKLEFTVEEPDFEIVVNGFDKNLRLRMRLNYEEARDAAAIDAE